MWKKMFPLCQIYEPTKLFKLDFQKVDQPTLGGGRGGDRGGG